LCSDRPILKLPRFVPYKAFINTLTSSSSSINSLLDMADKPQPHTVVHKMSDGG